MIPYGQQDINQADLDAVMAVLTSSHLTQGPQVPQFEAAICALTGANFAVAVNSATSALHIACIALGVTAGDWVWTSPITFVASANCALYCGANIDFVDVDRHTGNMCPDALAQKLAWAASHGTLPKVIIPVHLAGHSCDMQAIGQLAKRYGVKVIEDASHAIGGRYHSRMIGACQYSDICLFSFHPVKIITSAEGGMATTMDAGLAQAMMMARSHGITKDAELMQRPDEGDWYYEQHGLGFNYRMTDMQAALGRSQLSRLQEFVSQRNQLAQQYHSLLSGLPLQTVRPLLGSVSSYHLQIVRLDNAERRRQVFDDMRALGIQVHVHYFPVYLQPYYQKLGFKAGLCPQAEQFYQQILTLPLFPQLSAEQQNTVVNSLKQVLQ
ncbi:UDP-4-amino-4,6-dideoxy-N-acetyl-beta-L-altrosamine transaminase [Shewanella sp. NIFS-20-20]|uniref:UDP-4-amino-4, 6-dideoxy-N-acetyl-beta-L-altrosamine transaminase n=1 Tax=Shewanella sp. NIFS-20-20 TaxID=2853806 RepID=UPI001C47FA99|nr:UDP-4-amino-4,6-dideoxy-N-acetyl-beta-L-altrosamine transaminase [Shewanella sp. NIFS-20-20]MBV7316395.1 UDP-4-amino-4,6-dideoxy-N-acetyl-beta-L-altrosamine transaminase [Shewanella sp. NIFS-20-20]